MSELPLFTIEEVLALADADLLDRAQWEELQCRLQSAAVAKVAAAALDAMPDAEKARLARHLVEAVQSIVDASALVVNSLSKSSAPKPTPTNPRP